jgi:hypothetical protein
VSNPSKAKGSAWETTLETSLRDMFGNAERLTLNGALDQGDVWFVHHGQPYVVEAKAERAINLSGYVDEAYLEARNWATKRPIYPLAIPVVMVKRRNHSVLKSYVVQEFAEWVRTVKVGAV